MAKSKFSGWAQLVLVALVGGFTSILFGGILLISNTVMFSGQQIVISATLFGLGFSVYSFMQGPPQLLLAQFIRKIGSRKILTIGSILMAVIGLGISNFINSGITFVIIYGGLYGFAFMATSQLASQTLVNNWFHQRRGQAQSLMRAIGALFQIAAPYLATFFTTRFGGGFKVGWRVGGITAAIAIILCFFLKNTPQECGQVPDGLAGGETGDVKKKAVKVSTVYKRPIDQPSISLKEAQKMPIFWAMVVVSTLGFTVMMINPTFNAHFRNYGFSLETISTATAIRSVLGVVLLLGVASISDKIEPAFIYGLCFVMFAGCCFITANLVSAGTWVIYVAYFLFTAMFSCGITLMPMIYANYFGVQHFPAIQGFSLLLGGLLSSTTGVITGALADLTGGFSFAYNLYGFVALAAAAIMVFAVGIPSARKYKREIAGVEV
jgi:MFS family permease